MIDLDDPASLVPDRSGMFTHIRALGRELVRAWHNSQSLVLPHLTESLDSIVVAGMGGSATAGDYFATMCSGTSPIPVMVVRGAALPAFASDRTLVVVSSYSGETAESLACYDEARRHHAPIVAITAGGKLAARAATDGVPVVRIDYVSPPRAAIAHTIAPLLRLGATLEICPADQAIVEEAAAHCDLFTNGLTPDVPRAQNAAKLIAYALWGRMPLVVGGEHLAPVTTRFKNQLAENGKTLAIAETLPEAAHNIVVGLETAQADAPALAVVLLDSSAYGPGMQRVANEVATLFAEHGIAVRRAMASGASTLAQMLTATALGDYASCYLALLHGIDPTPIPEIERMRALSSG
ncbi:MAG TPA: bifunctional phosphoglucose/phosphomannose isomerase [Tepidiformaceae bacterium]|nr:bifunctional phosphoglucose/phosphomannose isomerase [Tepidiformaceae bacterium]